eukprot:6188694-Pleurochrysis_carterae.AAC.1
MGAEQRNVNKFAATIYGARETPLATRLLRDAFAQTKDASFAALLSLLHPSPTPFTTNLSPVPLLSTWTYGFSFLSFFYFFDLISSLSLRFDLFDCTSFYYLLNMPYSHMPRSGCHFRRQPFHSSAFFY